jgi:UDP-N-acetylmuramoyl-tripeptide--D-alanyl-D-alanine ligase
MYFKMTFFYVCRMIDKIYRQFLDSTGISTDTRSLKGGEVFFCLKGNNFNGNEFANEALLKGAKIVVLDEEAHYDATNKKQLLVKNSLDLLQKLALHHRRKQDIPLIGITGSNGKTTTKELITAVLDTQYKVFSTPGNFNNHIGVPLSLLKIEKKHQIAVIEMGANRVGEIADLCKLSNPNCGIITNIGQAHLEGFRSYKNIKKTKLALYESLRKNSGFVFVKYEDEELMEESTHMKRETYGFSNEADVQVRLKSGKPNLELEYNGELISTQLFGEFNIFNVAAAIAIGKHFKVSNDNIKKALETFHPANNRSQIVKGKNNLLIMDAYNANPDSMTSVIEFFGHLKAYSKSLILGDMLELGEFEQTKHKEILDLIGHFNFDHVFLVGQAFGQFKNEFPQYEFFDDSHQAKKHFETFPIQTNQILLKGSRGIKLEILKDTIL